MLKAYGKFTDRLFRWKKPGWKAAAAFIVFQIFFACITLPLFVFFGPFDGVKSTVVGASYRTFKHQYIAELFLSKDKIKRILEEVNPHDPTEKGEDIKVLKFGVRNTDRIEVLNLRGIDYTGKLMIVYDPTRIKVGYSSQIPVSGETTSIIAKKNGAVAAVNAGGFKDGGWVGTGGTPIGFIMHGGKVLFNESGNEKARMDTIAFTEDGMLIVGKHSIEKLKEYGVREGVSFGPPLIVNGEPTITKGDGGWGIAPRTAIGQCENGEVLLLVIDGRSLKSLGATLRDMQDILLKYGAVNAANLDGGSSTTMFFNGRVINVPSDRLGERAVPTVFMVSPAEGSEHE
ncbi:MAG: phosphodiester glycosidase family protein [Clostridia bacterium]|nr:phosphodiester glycosidase family protein [Clostridia bacterium]